jgi:hypothetical protein
VKLPESDAELNGLYQSVLNGKRALLLVDNAASSAHVVPLIPPTSCFLLVTSRRYFTLPGLIAKRLGKLLPKDAHDLLLKIAPRIGEHAEVLAQLCGYLPLALRAAASAIAEHIDIDPKVYRKRLEDTKQRLQLTDVEASLSLSFELLSPE